MDQNNDDPPIIIWSNIQICGPSHENTSINEAHLNPVNLSDIEPQLGIFPNQGHEYDTSSEIISNQNEVMLNSHDVTSNFCEYDIYSEILSNQNEVMINSHDVTTNFCEMETSDNDVLSSRSSIISNQDIVVTQIPTPPLQSGERNSQFSIISDQNNLLYDMDDENMGDTSPEQLSPLNCEDYVMSETYTDATAISSQFSNISISQSGDTSTHNYQSHERETNDVMFGIITSSDSQNYYKHFDAYLSQLSHDEISDDEKGKFVDDNVIQYGNGLTNQDSSRKFLILNSTQRYLEKFKMTVKEVVVKFSEWTINDRNISGHLDALLEYLTSEFAGHDRIQLEFQNIETPDKSFYISFRRVDQLNAQVILDRIYRLVQSNAAFMQNDRLRINCHIAETPLGSGLLGLKPGDDLEEIIKRKYSIINIPASSANLCLPLAIIVALELKINPAGLEKISTTKFPRSRWIELNIKARDLCTHCGIQLPVQDGLGFDAIVAFDDYLHLRFMAGDLQHRFRIVVYSNLKGDIFFQSCASTDKTINLNLLLVNNHYYVIRNITAAFSCKYFCEYCNRQYSRITDHRCEFRCKFCFTSPPCDQNNNNNAITTLCPICNRSFFNTECYNNHKNIICQKLKYCVLCNKTYIIIDKEAHQCGFIYCNICCEKRPEGHQCFIPKYQPTVAKNRVFLFFDFECIIEESDSSGLSEHRPNLCITQVVCNQCVQIEDNQFSCMNCGPREKIFIEKCFKLLCRGECLLEELFEYIFDLIHKRFYVILIGHNAGFYDSHILLKYIINNPQKFHELPQIISRGTKIYSITCSTFKIIDSINFFGVGLSKLPGMFGFTEQKGFFPYLFNNIANMNYVGVWPDKKYYLSEGMKTPEKLQFDDWWLEKTQSGQQYNHREEMITYCSLDVSILRMASVKFYQNFLSQFGFNIFDKTLTIAATCNRIYRSKFMSKDTFGIIPINGYRLRDNQSAVAFKWLYSEETRRGIIIEHAGNGREKKIGPYYVDGYYKDPITQTEIIFEFFGCYYHSCLKCYPHVIDTENQSLEFVRRREDTEKKLAYLRARFDNVVIQWECDFLRQISEDPELRHICSNAPYLSHAPLNPRDAFYGGRTSVIKNHYLVGDDERILYYDVCSLYPFVNKKCKVPLGHPRIYIGNATSNINLHSFEGILKVKVLPPSDLYHPVLPFKMHNKLMFFLCYSCALNSEEDCTHNDNERSFTGTWVADELRKAIEVGYVILEVYEAWEYRVQTGVFAEYVDTFLKEKQEASGYPAWCDTEEKKQQYIANYLEHEGIQLDPSRITKNPAKRSSAKLCLNSFWGKFGENSSGRNKVEIVTDSHRFFQLVMNPSLDITKIISVNDNCLLVTFESILEATEPLNHVNVAVAAYTTCCARLELYKYLQVLQRRVIYMDTDSIIFSQKPNEVTLQLGDYLGDLTDELTDYGQGSYILEFVSGGPKNYAFEVFSPLTNSRNLVCKVKGISLNFENSQIVNFASLRDMVLNQLHETDEYDDDSTPFLVTSSSKIIRKGMGNLYSKTEKKIYKLNYTKRKLIANYDSVPWGYRN